jgi:uncharacterized protein with HEPN domain
MQQAILEIQGFMAGVSQEIYLETLWLQRVVERNFEIFGEAARQVSSEFQVAHPELDWRNTIGLRNLIAHRYSDVDHVTLWTIINEVLPGMLRHLSLWLSDLDQ